MVGLASRVVSPAFSRGGYDRTEHQDRCVLYAARNADRSGELYASSRRNGVDGETGSPLIILRGLPFQAMLTQCQSCHRYSDNTGYYTTPLYHCFTIHPMMKLAKLPRTSPPVRQNPARDPAMSFSSSSMAGFSDGDEAMIMLRDEIQLRRQQGSELRRCKP